MNNNIVFLFGVAVGAAVFLSVGTASATTLLLRDTLGDGTSLLNTNDQLTGGDATVKASMSGVAFTDTAYFSVGPTGLSTSYDVITEGTSKLAEISGGTAEIFNAKTEQAVAGTSITLGTAAKGEASTIASSSGEFSLVGPGSYYVQIESFGVDTVKGQRDAEYSIELQGAAVPEPVTWAVMLVGFGGVGASMRGARRRRALAT